jgi:hypothetical protein
MGVKIGRVVVDANEGFGEADHFVALEGAEDLAAGVIGYDVSDVGLGVEFGVGPDGAGDLDAPVEVVERVDGTDSDVRHRSFQQ